MIIIGYPGIGKSTLSKDCKAVDLESSNFYNNNGIRPESWVELYCNIAEDISNQGYVVFTSSHKAVRREFINRKTENIYAIIPDISLKDEWVDKLYNRFITSKDKKEKDKNWKAYENSKYYYAEYIKDIINDDQNIKVIIIDNMNYDLEEIITKIKENKI